MIWGGQENELKNKKERKGNKNAEKLCMHIYQSQTRPDKCKKPPETWGNIVCRK